MEIAPYCATCRKITMRSTRPEIQPCTQVPVMALQALAETGGREGQKDAPWQRSGRGTDGQLAHLPRPLLRAAPASCAASRPLRPPRGLEGGPNRSGVLHGYVAGGSVQAAAGNGDGTESGGGRVCGIDAIEPAKIPTSARVVRVILPPRCSRTNPGSTSDSGCVCGELSTECR